MTDITSEQNGPFPSISLNTAIADAGDLATPSVAANEATATRCAVDAPGPMNSTPRPTNMNVTNTNTHENTVMLAVITSVGFGERRRSARCSSLPAATPMSARQRLSSPASPRVASTLRTPRTCEPHRTPVTR